jgi:hypothetical protein
MGELSELASMKLSSMKLFGATALMIVAVAGCSRERGATTPVVETTELGDLVTMDPNNILFTTPTLNDAIPPTEAGSKIGLDCIQLHEDDWRQFEFVDASLKSEIDAELADIGAIWDQNSVPLGEFGTSFREVHVRKRIPNALNISMRLAEFEALVGQRASPLTFYGYDEVLRDVHAVQIDRLVVYAAIHDDHVTTIGLDAVEQFTLPPNFLERLARFVEDRNVVLVHWRSRTLIESHNDIMAYFGARG